ncbi:MAG: DoxX family protein [Acidimicrobiales bacterium]
MAGLMLGAGTTHFVAPAAYERTIPRWFGAARRVVLASGAAEIACGGLLLSRRTGKFGGWLTAALLVVVFPANVQMALDAGTEHQAVPKMPVGRFRLVALARLPLQLPLVGWALRVARSC